MSTDVSPAAVHLGISPDCSVDVPDLTQPDDFSDVILLVGERRLYTCRGILASASPVWRRMFTAGFKEKEAKEIPLPGKNFDDVVELLLCVTPAIQKPISGITEHFKGWLFHILHITNFHLIYPSQVVYLL